MHTDGHRSHKTKSTGVEGARVRPLTVFVLSLTLIAWIAGCGRWQESLTHPQAKPWKPTPVAGTPRSQSPDSPSEAGPDGESRSAKSIESSQTDSNDLPGDGTYNTGDCESWPSYELPMVIEIEVFELPEDVTRRADPIPDEEA